MAGGSDRPKKPKTERGTDERAKSRKDRSTTQIAVDRPPLERRRSPVHGVAGDKPPPPPKLGQTPFTLIAHSPALSNWEKAVQEVLQNRFDQKFNNFKKANDHFKQHLKTLPRPEAEAFADEMRDVVRKKFYRLEGKSPSFDYDREQTERLKRGAAPSETLQLEHNHEVKSKIWRIRTSEGTRRITMLGEPELALDPVNIQYSEGGKRGTAPRGTPHQLKRERIVRSLVAQEERVRSVAAARQRSTGSQQGKAVESTALESRALEQGRPKAPERAASPTTRVEGEPPSPVPQEKPSSRQRVPRQSTADAPRASRIRYQGPSRLGVVAGGATSAVEVWSALTTLNEVLKELVEAGTGRVDPHTAQIVAAINKEFPTGDAVWGDNVTRYDAEQAPRSAKWLNDNGKRVISLNPVGLPPLGPDGESSLASMGEHLNTLSHHISDLGHLEEEIVHPLREITPMSHNINLMHEELGAIVRQLNAIWPLLPKDSEQAVGYTLTRNVEKARQNIGAIQSAINNRRRDYLLKYEQARNTRRTLTLVFNHWAPQFAQRSPHTPRATRLPLD